MSLVALVVICLSVGAGSQQAPSLAAAFQELDTQLAADFAKDGIGGVSVGVVSGDALVWTKNYGQGRVFYSSLGHQGNVVASEPNLTIMRRGFLWAARA